MLRWNVVTGPLAFENVKKSCAKGRRICGLIGTLGFACADWG